MVRLGDLHVVAGVVVVARIRSTVPTNLHLPYHRSTVFDMVKNCTALFESLATPVPCKYMQPRLGFAVATDLLGELGPVPPHPPANACSSNTFFTLCWWLWNIVSVSERAGVVAHVDVARPVCIVIRLPMCAAILLLACL